MEFCGSRTLDRLIGSSSQNKIEEDKAKMYFRQLVDGVEFLHAHSVFHRDLTLANILVTRDEVIKIVDFGLCCTSEEKQYTPCGTIEYFSPQMMGKEEYTSRCVDIWCLGVILYRIVLGFYPFGGRTFIIDRY